MSAGKPSIPAGTSVPLRSSSAKAPVASPARPDPVASEFSWGPWAPPGRSTLMRRDRVYPTSTWLCQGWLGSTDVADRALGGLVSCLHHVREGRVATVLAAHPLLDLEVVQV